MSGVIVVAGIFGPGSVVDLFHAESDVVLRPEGSELVDQRIVDESGNVGWDDLEVGEPYFIRGYINGFYTLVRARATDSASPEISQAPIQDTPQQIGTQQDPPIVDTPEPPANADELETGVAPGAAADLPLGEGETAPTGMEPPVDASAGVAPPSTDAPAQTVPADGEPTTTEPAEPVPAEAAVEPPPAAPPAGAPVDPVDAPGAAPVVDPAAEPPPVDAEPPASPAEGADTQVAP